MVSLAGSLAWRLAQENVFLSFASQDFEGTADVHDFLQYLATITAKSQVSILESLTGSTDYSVVFTSQKRGTIPASMWASSYFLFAE